MEEIKEITLHPLLADGTMDLGTNLYPKTLKTCLLNGEGEPAHVVEQYQLDELEYRLRANAGGRLYKHTLGLGNGDVAEITVSWIDSSSQELSYPNWPEIADKFNNPVIDTAQNGRVLKFEYSLLDNYFTVKRRFMDEAYRLFWTVETKYYVQNGSVPRNPAIETTSTSVFYGSMQIVSQTVEPVNPFN